jgi:hypothetical protein
MTVRKRSTLAATQACPGHAGAIVAAHRPVDTGRAGQLAPVPLIATSARRNSRLIPVACAIAISEKAGVASVKSVVAARDGPLPVVAAPTSPSLRKGRSQFVQVRIPGLAWYLFATRDRQFPLRSPGDGLAPAYGFFQRPGATPTRMLERQRPQGPLDEDRDAGAE